MPAVEACSACCTTVIAVISATDGSPSPEREEDLDGLAAPRGRGRRSAPPTEAVSSPASCTAAIPGQGNEPSTSWAGGVRGEGRRHGREGARLEADLPEVRGGDRAHARTPSMIGGCATISPRTPVASRCASSWRTSGRT